MLHSGSNVLTNNFFFAGQNDFIEYQEPAQPVYQPLPESEFTPLEYPVENEVYNSYLPGQTFYNTDHNIYLPNCTA